MSSSQEQRTIFCLVFNSCEFPVRPDNYVYFFDRLGPNYTVKTVSIQATKTIQDVKFNNRYFKDTVAPETVHYHADLALAELLEIAKIDVLCIPGGSGARALIHDLSLRAILLRVVAKAEWVVTEALGSTFLAVAGILDGKRAVIPRAWDDESRLQYPKVRWETGPFFRSQGKILHQGKFIMSDNLGRSAPSTEVSAATAAADFFLALVERGEDPVEPSFPSAAAQETNISVGQPMPNTAVNDRIVNELADKIKLEREDMQIIRIAEDFALRLASEGYISDCNAIISEILRHSPDAFNFLIKRALETLWHTVGPRPETPYAVPSDAELVEMEKEQRYYDLRERQPAIITNLNHIPFAQLAPDQVRALGTALAAVKHLSERKLISLTELGGGARAKAWDEGPITMPTKEEERRGLEVFKNYMSRRDEDDSPTDRKLLTVYANLALKYGWEAEGKQWLDLALRGVLKSNWDWIGLASLAAGRYCSALLGGGTLRSITGTTAEAAHHAAEIITKTLSERWDHGETKPFAALPWTDLLLRLEEASAKAQDDETQEKTPYMLEPATENAIAAAELRLGLTLPADYKAFLRLTNGTGSPSPFGQPPLALVEDIRWDAEMPRIAMFKVEPLPRVHGKEWNALPALKRVLQISVEGWEEYVYLIEPEMVALLPGHGNAVAENKWMTSTWAAWRADHIPYESFRDYMERLLVDG